MELLSFLSFFGLLAVASATDIPTAVVQLSDRFLEVKDEGYWFVKLYAPWLANCKQMAPIWEHVGHSLADKNPLIRVSSMDCTLFPKACHGLGVTGYPTLMFFRNGQVLQYEGEREKEAMVDFAIKAAAPLVSPIQSLNQYNEIKSASIREPVFLRVTPEKDEAGEGTVAEAFKNAASDLLSKSRFYSISSNIAPQNLKEGHVYVLRDVGIEEFDGDADGLLNWIYGERLPLLPKASSATLPQLALSEKLIVLVVANQIDRFTASHPVGALYATGLAAAKASRGDEELRKKIQFAWVDGGSLVSSIAMQPVEPPFVLVLNYSSYKYYLPQDAPEKMTEASLMRWLRETVLSHDTVYAGGRYGRAKRVFDTVKNNMSRMVTLQILIFCSLYMSINALCNCQEFCRCPRCNLPHRSAPQQCVCGGNICRSCVELDVERGIHCCTVCNAPYEDNDLLYAMIEMHRKERAIFSPAQAVQHFLEFYLMECVGFGFMLLYIMTKV